MRRRSSRPGARGAVAQLERVLGPASDEVERAAALVERAVAPLPVVGRPLFAGLRSWWDDPVDRWTRLFHLGDMLREARGDAHISAWASEGLDGLEIGLLNDLYMGLQLRSYVRTRGWSEEELEAGVDRLREQGWLDGDALSDDGRAVREDIESATDLQMAPALDALEGDLTELVDLLRPWGAAMREAGGYVGGAVDLWPVRDDMSADGVVVGTGIRAVGVLRVPRPPERDRDTRQDARAHT